MKSLRRVLALVALSALGVGCIGCNIGAGLISADLTELSTAMAQARNPDHTLNLARWGKSDDPAKTSGMENLTPLWLLKYLPNMLACHVSIIHDTQGPSNTITCGQASAGLALAEAARTIQRGHADLALVGGCETKVHEMGLLRWSLLHRLNTTSNDSPATTCRPYDTSAAGTVLAEGGAVLIIEELTHALARGLAAAADGVAPLDGPVVEYAGQGVEAVTASGTWRLGSHAFCGLPAEDAGSGVVSDENTSARASGKRCCTSSRIRSTPGPTAIRLSCAPQCGQVFGFFIEKPVRWQTRRPVDLCSTSHESVLGEVIFSPHALHSTSGA